jgi:hypothetical protein
LYARGSCSAEQGGAVVSPGATNPMIHCLWTWTTLIIAPEAVVGLLLGSVCPTRKLIGAAGPTQLLCDAPTVLKDVQDHSLMAVATVKCCSIDPSASNLSLLIQPTYNQCFSCIQDLFVGLLRLSTHDVACHRCGCT